MEKRESLFADRIRNNYPKLINTIYIGGLTDETIAQYSNNGQISFKSFNFLMTFPLRAQDEIKDYTLAFKLIYSDNDYFPKHYKFFLCTFEQYRYFYSLKFTEEIMVNNKKIQVPVVIIIESYKEDIYQFKMLLSLIYQQYIMSYEKESDQTIINDYRKIELLNIFSFCHSLLYKPSPHTNIKLYLPCLGVNDALDFYYSSNTEIPCNKVDYSIQKLFYYLDLSIIIKIVMKLLQENTVLLVSSNPLVLINIIPALKKLIFPIEWCQKFIPISPEPSLGDGSAICLIGVVRESDEEIESIIQEMRDVLFVDCDTNEIVGDVTKQLFCPLPCSILSEKAYPLLTYHKNKLMQYEPSNKSKPVKPLTLLKSGQIIIDCDDHNKLYVPSNEQYYTRQEYSELRKNIQKLKNKSIESSERESLSACNSNSTWSHLLNDSIEVNFDREVNLLFAKLIYSKLENKKDYLFNDIKSTISYNYSVNIKQFDNDSSISIMKNILENKYKYSFDNAIDIIFNILPFKLPLLNKNKEMFIKAFQNYEKYFNSNKSNSMNESIPLRNSKTVIANNGTQLCFYGANGFIEFAKLFFESVEDVNTFYTQQYYMPLLKEIREDIKVQNTIIEDDIFYDETDDLNENLNLGAYEIDEEKNKNKITNESKEKKKDDTVIAFHSKERGLSETAEYHLYISTLLQEFVKLKIEKEDSSCYNSVIFDSYCKAYQLNKVDFPFYSFYSFLKTLPQQTIESYSIVLQNDHEYKDLCTIIETFIN